MKRIISYIICVIGLVSSIITIITGYDEACRILGLLNFPTWLSTVLYILCWLFFIIFLIVASIISVNWLTKRTRMNMGTHGIPCSLYYMFKYKFCIENKTVLTEMHNQIYHQYYILKQRIDKNEFYNEKSKQQAIGNYLGYVQNSIHNVFKIKLNISIKKIAADINNNCILTPYAHCKNNQNTDSHTERNFDFYYLIQSEASNDMKLHTCRAKGYNQNKGNGLYKVNSIFTYLLNNDSSYWMSNNLLIDEKGGIFYTSSDNYNSHYRSMAVFKIIPPENNSAAKGIIVFDSLDTNKYSESECKLFMGYVAHLIYELM